MRTEMDTGEKVKYYFLWRKDWLLLGAFDSENKRSSFLEDHAKRMQEDKKLYKKEEHWI